MGANTLRYAITVSRKDGRFLFFEIRRNPSGDIYFNYPKPRGAPRQWKPHTSAHSDGTIHDKDFGRKFMARKGPKPDVSFVGIEQITSLVMNPQQWRNIVKPFNSTRFADTFDIDVEKLSLDTRLTQLQLDLVAPNVKPNLIRGASALQQGFFKDAAPWIALTLIDTTSL